MASLMDTYYVIKGEELIEQCQRWGVNKEHIDISIAQAQARSSFIVNPRRVRIVWDDEEGQVAI